MSRFVVDAGAVLRLAEERTQVLGKHQLLAPTLLRSQVLSLLHEAVHRGDLPNSEARERLAKIARMADQDAGGCCAQAGGLGDH